MPKATLNEQTRANVPRPATDRTERSVTEALGSSEEFARNSIRPTKRRNRPVPETSRQQKAAGADAGAKKPRERGREIPEDVRKRFTQVGNRFYFPDGTQAFTDRGSRLISVSENTEVVKSLITIAQTRGWTDLTVTGTERFRREAWFVARQAGLEVRGYKPTAYEEGRVVRTLAREGEPPSLNTQADSRTGETTRRNLAGAAERHVSEGGTRGETREFGRSLHTGRLADHGSAPYRHDPKNAMSYFVRVETAGGDREIWGVDLHRALKESLTRPQIGDEIGLRAVRRDTVTLQRAARDNNGKNGGNRPLTAHRKRWIVEQRDFFAERVLAARLVRDPKIPPKAAVRERPELAGTFLKIRASELAAKAIRDPEDRRRFVETVRTALASEVARGEPLTPVRLKERPDRQVDPRVLQPDHTPGR